MMADINALIVQLQQHLDALGDGRDLTSDNARAEHATRVMAIRRTLSGLRNAGDVAALDTRITVLLDRRAVVLAKQREIEHAIDSARDPTTLTDARERDRAFEEQRQLRLQLQRLHAGRLLQAPDICFERVDDLDQQIIALQGKRTRAQLALDSHLTAAEQWLGTPTSSA
jgi:hypothetical protein